MTIWTYSRPPSPNGTQCDGSGGVLVFQAWQPVGMRASEMLLVAAAVAVLWMRP